jgi:hypothetical protein
MPSHPFQDEGACLAGQALVGGGTGGGELVLTIEGNGTQPESSA